MKVNSIRPSSDLRNHYNEISRFCHESGEPVYITLNGRGDTTILSIERYSELMDELERLKSLVGTKEAAKEKVTPARETVSEVRDALEIIKSV